MKLVLEEKARKSLKKLHPEVIKRIVSKLEFFSESVNPLDFAEKLVNHDAGQYRFRVGDYRIIFDVENETIVILTIGHRREIYK